VQCIPGLLRGVCNRGSLAPSVLRRTLIPRIVSVVSSVPWLRFRVVSSVFGQLRVDARRPDLSLARIETRYVGGIHPRVEVLCNVFSHPKVEVRWHILFHCEVDALSVVFSNPGGGGSVRCLQASDGGSYLSHPQAPGIE
jgi:hypothetical protein